jgi:hypothetical protein
MNPLQHLFCVSLCLLLLLEQGAAHADSSTEVAVKIGFIFNFLKLIEWPADAASREPLVLCTSGAGPVSKGLLSLEGKTVNGKLLTVHREVQGDALRACHMVYLSDQSNCGAIISNLHDYPVVTVSDRNEFIQAGGMIWLVSEGDRLRFEVNLKPFQENRVRIPSSLLRLAKTVQGAI